MEKSQKRGVRRWRSFSKWMTRLKRDWNDHGWGRGLDGRYDCECFYLGSAQALRFKDTPNGCNCSSCANPRRTYDGRSSEALTFAERREFLGDREDWSKRKRRPGQRLFKVCCVGCGIQIKVIWVKNHRSAFAQIREAGLERRCESCRKRFLEAVGKRK